MKARNKLYCIMFTGTSLSDAACDALFQAACDCVRDEKYKKKIYHDDVTGEVHTEFDFGSTGDIGGILFEGDIETVDGETKVTYIVQRYELEKVRNHMNWLKMDFDEFINKLRKSHEYN